MRTFLNEISLSLLAGMSVTIEERSLSDRSQVDHVIRVTKWKGGRSSFQGRVITAKDILEFGQEACYMNALGEARSRLARELGESHL